MKNKEYIAPIVVTIISLLVVFLYILTFFDILNAGYPEYIWAALCLLALIATAVTLVYVLLRRIKEIKEDQKDDYRKY